MNPRLILIPLIAIMAAANAASAWAQDKGTVHPKPLPPLANPNDPKIAAKELFGRKVLPAAMPTRVHGFYAHGCISGAEGLPINGDNWQVMRLSRNRYWGHPDLVALVKRLAAKARKDAGWPGILVGDMSQPRGGPMFTGHASHQVGLDADIWLTPMPNRQLSRNEREETSAVMMVRADRLDIDPNAWTPTHLAVIRAAALEPSVQRIFVNAAIKKALCREAKGDRYWLHKVRPMYGHDYHFHIRIKCPPGAERMRQPARSERRRRLQHERSRLLVQRCGASSQAARGAAEAKAADDHGVAATGLQNRIARAGREALTAQDQIRRRMTMKIWPVIASIAFVTSVHAQTPYAGMQTRPIKALSEQQIADLGAGRGMGLALAAELNGYPGPLHVLELADKLELSAEQRAGMQRLFDSMKAEAMPLGAKLIEQEAELDKQFASRTVTPESLKASTAAVAATQGILRETHLKYHLSTGSILTPSQMTKYAELRGYGGGGHKRHHHH